MTDQKSKIAFIVVLYKTPKQEVERLKREIRGIGFVGYKIYFIDNTRVNRGYAAALNIGIKKALKDNCDVFVVANPDISIKKLIRPGFLEAGKHFDVWGFAMRQQGKVYYGGEIDRLRLSGGLIEEKPQQKFVETDFISGSLMVIKKDVIERVGYFDERYFMYYEEVDYCLRAKRAGFKVGIDSQRIYDHFEKSSSNPEKKRLLADAHNKFFAKHSSINQRIYYRMTNLIRSNFLRNFFSLNVSSIIGKFFNFILFIFLIRYLQPEEYGIYTLVWAQITLFSPLLDLGTTSYGIVYLPTEKKQRFISIFNLRLTASIIIFLTTIITSFLIFKPNVRLVQYIFLTSFVIFSNMLSGSYLIKNAVQGKLYYSSFVSTFFNIVLISTLIFSVIAFQSLPLVFLLIFVFYNLYSVVNYFLIKKDFKQFIFSIDLVVWKGLLQKSYLFILISLFAGIYFKIDVFLLNILKGEGAVGIYSAGYKFFEAFLFIAASYNITRTPVLAKLVKGNRKKLISLIKKDILFLLTVGLSISLITLKFAPIFLPFFLKENYSFSIKTLQIVIFALPFILVSSVFLNALYVLEKAKFVVGIFMFQTILNLVLNLVFIPHYSYFASSYITVISEILNTLMLFLIFYKVTYENIS